MITPDFDNLVSRVISEHDKHFGLKKNPFIGLELTPEQKGIARVAALWIVIAKKAEYNPMQDNAYKKLKAKYEALQAK